jgi:hypothetical protein
MNFLEAHAAWEDIFGACQEVFRIGIDLHIGEKQSSNRELDRNSSFHTAVLDWSLWKQFIKSASHSTTPEK